MCGIVGLFLKDPSLEPQLGSLTEAMLATLSDRGPDSAGFAVYGEGRSGETKITLRAASPRRMPKSWPTALAEPSATPRSCCTTPTP